MSSIIDGNNDLSNPVMTSSRPSSAIDPKFFHDTSIVLMSPVSSSRRTSIGNLYDIPYARNHNLLSNTNRFSILTIPCGPAMLSRRKSSGDPPETLRRGSPDFLAKSLVIPAIYTKFKLKFVSDKLEFCIYVWNYQ